VSNSADQIKPVTLATRRVFLHPVERDRYSFLYRRELGGDMIARWRFGGSTPAPDEYPSLLWRGVYSQYFVFDQVSGLDADPIGLVTAYNMDAMNGTVYLAAVRFTEGTLASALFMEGCAVFFDSIFRSSPTRKIYAESAAYNVSEFRSAIRDDLFHVEGTLLEHRFYDGKYWNVSILSLTRERWLAVKEYLPSLYE
jgi:hypothetical protein